MSATLNPLVIEIDLSREMGGLSPAQCARLSSVRCALLAASLCRLLEAAAAQISETPTVDIVETGDDFRRALHLTGAILNAAGHYRDVAEFTGEDAAAAEGTN